MEHDAKSGHIVLENFNSTANLASNPGFQSTLTLGSKEVVNEKAYDPFEHRNVEHPNSSFGSLVHLLKSSLGSGILAMPAAFKNAGLAAGAIGTIFIGFIATHCVYVLVKTSQELCAEVKQPQMGFAETCGAAFQYGPKKTRRFAGFARLFVDYAMACTYFAALCVYVLFIAENFQEVSDVYLPEYNLTVKIYCALTLVPLVLMCQIRNLQWLVPFSAIANVFLVLCFSITMYYLFSDMPDFSSRQMVAPVPQWPLFISTVIFAMEGIGVVMPVENEMSKPQQFLGCPGVLNISMSIVVGLYGLFGFFGYLKYGDAVKGSITLSLPQDEILAQSAKILMALAILFTYGLQFYVCMEMIWRQIQDKIAVRYHNVSQIGIRTALVVASVIFAIAFPDLELIISLIGAIFLSTLGLLTPAVVDTVHNWERNIGFLYWKVWKNILISFISLLALFVGSYSSVSQMIRKFGHGAVAHETVANQTMTGMLNDTIGL